MVGTAGTHNKQKINARNECAKRSLKRRQRRHTRNEWRIGDGRAVGCRHNGQCVGHRVGVGRNVAVGDDAGERLTRAQRVDWLVFGISALVGFWLVFVGRGDFENKFGDLKGERKGERGGMCAEGWLGSASCIPKKRRYLFL